MEYFGYLKFCLQHFEYPHIISLNDEQIAALFDGNNRGHLLTWLLKKINSSYEFLENSGQTQADVAAAITEMGFCSRNQALPFLAGELSSMEQVEIIYKMFQFLHRIPQQNTKDIKMRVLLGDIMHLVNSDMNLFTCYGPMQSLTEAEARQKCLEYQKEMCELRTITIRTNCHPKNNDGNFDELLNCLRMVKAQLPSLKAAVAKWVKEKQQAQNQGSGDIVFDPKLTEVLIEYKEKVGKITQYMSDAATINEIAEGIPNGAGADLVLQSEEIQLIAKLAEDMKNLGL